MAFGKQYMPSLDIVNDILWLNIMKCLLIIFQKIKGQKTKTS